MNNIILFLKEFEELFDVLTDFKDGQPQPLNDPVYTMWLNGLVNESGIKLNTDDEVKSFTTIIMEKRQTKGGIEELRSMVKERLSGM